MKTIRNIFGILATTLILGSCTQDDITAKNYVTFDVNNTNIELAATGSGEATVTVFSSNNVSGDMMFDVEVVEDQTSIDPANFQVSETVMIPSGSNRGEVQITLNNIDFTSNPSITLSFTDTEGFSFGQTTTFNIVEECTGTEGYMLITFDEYPGETSWEIYESGSDTPILSNQYSAGTVSTNERLCLQPGNYLFIIYDAYGDGMCCDFGEGSYQFILGDGTVVAEGGDFGDSESAEFTVN